MLKVWRSIKILLFLLVIILSITVTASAAGNTILFILDVSGSMASKLNGGTRMDAAKQTFSNLIEELPKELNVGLELYGHRGNKDCSAIEVVVPPQALDATAIKAKVAELQPLKGATPIADALATAGETLRDVEGEKTIILISDGEESCGGDPAATAARLRKEGVGAKIYVIGFGVNDKGRSQLQAVADAGGGQYYDAKDAAGLMAGLQEVKKQVVSKIIFRDDFSEEYIDEQWEVLNPNPDTAIVEDGMLQIITELPKGILFNPVNFLLLKQELPEQYEIVLKMRFTLLNGNQDWVKNQVAGILLFKDKENVTGLAASNAWGNSTWMSDAVNFFKVRNKEWVPGFKAVFGRAREEREITIKLQRIQRKFLSYYLSDKGEWVQIGEFTELRPKYRLGIFALRGGSDAREALEKFDWIEVKEIE